MRVNTVVLIAKGEEGKEFELYVIPTDGSEARLLAKFRYGIKNLPLYRGWKRNSGRYSD